MSINALLQPIQAGDAMHDYKHAAAVFVPNAFALHPHFAFSFWVRFTMNPAYTMMQSGNQRIIGSLAKTVNLPKFQIDTKTLNAYNRPNLVQTKIKYEPVTIKFHDDGENIIRKLWYDYYSFYFRDSDYESTIYNAPHKYQERLTDKWGYTLRQAGIGGSQTLYSPNTQLIQNVEIFSFHKKKFNSVKLINPVITSFQHGEHDMAGALMENQMTLSYETVTYASGFLQSSNFSDMLLNYDTNPSPLSSIGAIGVNNLIDNGGIPGITSGVVSQWTNGQTDQSNLSLTGKFGLFGSQGYNASGAAKYIGLLGGPVVGAIQQAIGGAGSQGPISIPSIGSVMQSGQLPSLSDVTTKVKSFF